MKKLQLQHRRRIIRGGYTVDYLDSVSSRSGLLLPLCPEIMDTITLTRPQSLSR